MSQYRLKCRKKIQKGVKTKSEIIMLLSNCEVCDTRKPKFIKGQKASGLLSSLGIKIPLSKIPLVGPLLF